MGNFNQIKLERCQALTFSFSDIRKHHHELIKYLAFDVRENFENFLARPDPKQEFVEKFQNEYNQMTMENTFSNEDRLFQKSYREDEETKAEWHLKRLALVNTLEEMT